jgi:1-deoxy-D-xylulose-5-phosphate reductoisomerase
LTFEDPDLEAFPMLPLAYEAARRGGLYPTAYNAADEVAVAAFSDGRIGFPEIAAVTKNVLNEDWSNGDDSIESILEGDQRARQCAAHTILEDFA